MGTLIIACFAYVFQNSHFVDVIQASASHREGVNFFVPCGHVILLICLGATQFALLVQRIAVISNPKPSEITLLSKCG